MTHWTYPLSIESIPVKEIRYSQESNDARTQSFDKILTSVYTNPDNIIKSTLQRGKVLSRFM